MMTTADEREDDPALAAFTDVIRESAKQRTVAELDQGLGKLLERIDSGRSRRWGWVRWSLVGMMAVSCVLAGLYVASDRATWLRAQRPPSPSYQIEGGRVLEGGYLHEAGRAGIKLSFNEGSRLVLRPGTRGRLRAVDNEGARVAIEQGTASFEVTPGTGRRWVVEVGPFLVTVKGTVFTVSWDLAHERLELSLRRGRVAVSGPMSGGELVLQAGERLVVSLPGGQTVISKDGAEEVGSDPVAALAPAPPPPPPSIAKNRPSGGSLSSAPARSMVTKTDTRGRWAEELLRGQWDRILEDAERDGVDAALEKASSEDLFALANAARYRRRPELARSALLAERRRFPSSPRAIEALFLLGRVEEALHGGAARAMGWYDAYLAAAPSGPYAAEALGRKMTITSEHGGPTGARPIAEEYLRRFPNGSYAGSAHSLLEAP